MILFIGKIVNANDLWLWNVKPSRTWFILLQLGIFGTLASCKGPYVAEEAVALCWTSPWPLREVTWAPFLTVERTRTVLEAMINRQIICTGVQYLLFRHVVISPMFLAYMNILAFSYIYIWIYTLCILYYPQKITFNLHFSYLYVFTKFISFCRTHGHVRQRRWRITHTYLRTMMKFCTPIEFTVS